MRWRLFGNSYEMTLIFIAFAFGCNMGYSVIVSQLFGAKEYSRLKTAVSTACIFSAFLCGKYSHPERYQWIRRFGHGRLFCRSDDDQQAVFVDTDTFYFIVSAKLVADGILRGGSAMGRFMTSTFTDLILRVVLAFVFSGWTGSAVGIWNAWPIGWTTATTMSIYFYQKEYRKYMDS